jgi:hypothetical protein
MTGDKLSVPSRRKLRRLQASVQAAFERLTAP